MPLSKLQFRAGINRENTNYANEGGWYDGDKVRFRSGSPQKIGGWQSLSDTTLYTFKGVARTLWNWITLNNSNIMAVGTDQKAYVEIGGAYKDITPVFSTGTLTSNPISTVNQSKRVVIYDAAHNVTVGTYVTISGATAVGGVTVSGEYEIIALGTTSSTSLNDYFQIAVPSAATSTASGGGSSVTVAYQANAGNLTPSIGAGWGMGVWGRGTWGSAYTGSAATPEVTALRLWSFDNYGEDLVLAPRGGAMYYWEVDVTTSPTPRAVTLKSLAATAGYDDDFVPNSVYEIHTSGVERFAIALGANPYNPLDANSTFDPMLVRWSDQENIYEWVPAVTNQAGEFRLSHGSQLVTGRHGRQEFLIWSDSAIYAMQYVGPPYVWSVSLLMDNISILSPGAVVGAGNVLYWMGVDKFYIYDGRVQTLPCAVRTYVFENLNQSRAYQVVAGSNAAYSEIWWHYPSANSTINDRYVVYNYLDNIWYYGSLSRTAWLDSPLRSKPMGVFSVQNSYLGADITASDTTIPVLTTTAYPASGTVLIESERISYTGKTTSTLTGCTRGVNATTAATHSAYTPLTFSTVNQVLYHEVGNDDASTPVPTAIASYIASSDFDIGDGHNFGFVWRILPDITFDGSTTPSPNYPSVTMVCKPRQNAGTAYDSPDAPAVASVQSYNTERVYTVQQFSGQVYTRVRGRQMAFEVRSTALGVAWQLGAPRIDVRPDGRR